MRYKLMNKQTGEEHICEKVTIDGMDYYLSDEKVHFGYVWNSILEQVETMFEEKTFHNSLKGIIATTNNSLICPKVVDGVERLAESIIPNLPYKKYVKTGFTGGYNKSQETHPFSEEDVRFMLSESFKASHEGYQITSDEIIQLWKEQQPKIVYYE